MGSRVMGVRDRDIEGFRIRGVLSVLPIERESEVRQTGGNSENKSSHLMWCKAKVRMV